MNPEELKKLIQTQMEESNIDPANLSVGEQNAITQGFWEGIKGDDILKKDIKNAVKGIVDESKKNQS